MKDSDEYVVGSKNIETFFSSQDEYEVYLTWKKSYNGQNFNKTGGKRFPGYTGTKNNSGMDGKQSTSKHFNGRSLLKDINPCDVNGVPYKCHVCNSIAHYARNCPHRIGASNQREKSSSNAVEPYIAETLQNVIENVKCRISKLLNPLIVWFLILVVLEMLLAKYGQTP